MTFSQLANAELIANLMGARAKIRTLISSHGDARQLCCTNFRLNLNSGPFTGLLFLTLTPVLTQTNRTAMIAASMEPITKCSGIKREDKRGENDAPAREVCIDEVLRQSSLKSVCMNLQHFLNLYHFLLLFNHGTSLR